MNVRSYSILATVLTGLCWPAASGLALADDDSARRQLALRQACTEQGGRFEQSWIYNDQGTQWGRILSCSTPAGFIRCQDGLCRGGRWAQSASVPTPGLGPDSRTGMERFPAEPAALSAALTKLSRN